MLFEDKNELLWYAEPSKRPLLIKKVLENAINRLKSRRLWRYLEPSIRGWLELAVRLRDIKFRSSRVLKALINVLKLVKPFLSLSNFFSVIGAFHAWRASKIAEQWGNPNAAKWRHDKAYQIYWGALSLQLSRVIPEMILPQINPLFHGRGLGRVIKLVRMMA